ncbi:uncharacterized protein LOC114535112 [Dendronephthya gigantea]|uniref:uncharacterized protein LOC114529892 n=1 Tax=Dendronephthya gigantea TaxID=151771 RepID=UPI00106CF0AE|nr:uncharacterized protein LOC114529892 [Dendronephthya gigantea]XP_028412294.1 uncharacterized protein LOC114535112 [Dendronephthya gigantea]
MSTNDSNETRDFEFHKLEWSTTSFKVSDFLRKFTLPQVVKVIEGYYGDDEDSSLGADQILSLHCIKSTDKVVGRDYRGKEVNIPLQCQNKVEVRPSNLKDVYESVEELNSAFPRFVRISQGYYSATTDEEILNVGDKLQLKSFDKKEEKLICVNQNGQTIELPKDCVAGFQPLTDGKEYFLAEIPTQFPMPLYVQFVDPPLVGKQNRSADSFFNSSLGAIYLENSYTEDIIIASTISQDGRRTVVTFPREIDIRLAVCEGMLQNTVAYAKICQALNRGMDLNHLILIDTVSAFRPRNSVREYPYRELIDPSMFANVPETGLETFEGLHTYSEVKKPVESNPVPTDKELKPDTHAPDASDDKAVGTNGAVVSEGPEASKSHDYENEDWVQEKVRCQSKGRMTPPMKPQRLVNNIKKDGEEIKTDSSSLSSQSDDSEIAKIEVSGVDSGTASKRVDISQHSVKQVCEILKELGMDRYIVKFESEKIDGEMLMCLDNDILMADFGMNKLHCMKLKKYLEGWRPRV